MLLILYWAFKSWTAWFSILITVGISVICWLVASSVALRFFILFLGVMSCFYTIVRLAFFPLCHCKPFELEADFQWDIIDVSDDCGCKSE